MNIRYGYFITPCFIQTPPRGLPLWGWLCLLNQWFNWNVIETYYQNLYHKPCICHVVNLKSSAFCLFCLQYFNFPEWQLQSAFSHSHSGGNQFTNKCFIYQIKSNQSATNLNFPPLVSMSFPLPDSIIPGALSTSLSFWIIVTKGDIVQPFCVFIQWADTKLCSPVCVCVFVRVWEK